MSDEGTNATKGTVYVIDGDVSPFGDRAGWLLTSEGEVLWSHVSSSASFLRSDLTTGFSDRRSRLESMYPQGCVVEVIQGWRSAPQWLRDAHDNWAMTRLAASEETP